MDRREFVRMLGAGGLLAGLGMLVGGCPAQEQTENGGAEPDAPPPPPEEEPAPPDNEGGDGPTPAEEAAATGDTEQAAVKCPNCGAENDVDEWGVEMTCWKCGHKWAPEKPA